jgi:hypothetical protein
MTEAYAVLRDMNLFLYSCSVLHSTPYVEYLNYLGRMIKIMQDKQAKLNPGLSWKKHYSTRRLSSPANLN